MAKYGIRDATIYDVEYLSDKLRDIDLREIDAVSGCSPKAALRSGLRLSDFCKVGTVDGRPVCIYGVRKASSLMAVGYIWMLGTDDVDKHAMKFARECDIQVSEMMKGYEVVYNHCLAESKKTIRWLKWLGFVFEDPKPHGRHNELFRRFYKEAA